MSWGTGPASFRPQGYDRYEIVPKGKTPQKRSPSMKIGFHDQKHSSLLIHVRMFKELILFTF